MSRFTVQAKLVQQTEQFEQAMAEIGVYQGASAGTILQNSAKRFLHCFDTFCGIPHSNKFDNFHKAGDFSDTSVARVTGHLNSVAPQRFKLHCGIFPKTIPPELDTLMFSFVHIDADVHETYCAALQFFYPRMVTGGIVLFDDYGAATCLGAKKAVDDFLSVYPEKLHATECQDSYWISKS